MRGSRQTLGALAGVAAIIAAAMSGVQARARQASDVMSEVNAVVERLVNPGTPAQEFTRCKMQDALWGAYDVQVHITMGTDGLPWLFELVGGHFSYKVDSAPIGGAPPRFVRSGRLQPKSREEAFARGIPFFLTRAVRSVPNVLNVTVESNPSVEIADALLLAVIDEQPDANDLPTTAAYISSSATSQVVTLTHDAIARASRVRLAALKGKGGTAMMVGCVISNEIDVGPALF